MKRPRRLPSAGPHTCPWWFGYSFDNPLRRMVHDPRGILGGLVTEGCTAADLGCGLGYFTVALADLVGSTGRVIALDIQPQMVDRARRRAARRGVGHRIDFRVCAPDRLSLHDPVDFALAFWMLHEVRDQQGLLAEVRSALRPSGRLLVVEPKGHVTARRFEATVRRVREAGFTVADGPAVRLSRAVVCRPADASAPGR